MLLKDRLARSAKSLSAPAIESGAMWDDSFATMRSARARVSCWPTLEVVLLMREVQETAEVLSHQAAV